MIVRPTLRGFSPPSQKTLVIPFATCLALSTSGGSGGTSYEFIELDKELAGTRHFGPWLESITAHTFTHIRTANARWKVVFYWSYDGLTWSASNDLFAEIGTLGQDIQTPYTNTDNFGLHMRYAIGVRAFTGTASESVNVSGSLALTFQT